MHGTQTQGIRFGYLPVPEIELTEVCSLVSKTVNLFR